MQKMTEKVRNIIEVDTGRNPAPAFEALKRLAQERKQATKAQQEEAAQERQNGGGGRRK